ncbi:hypothetical protein BMF89_00360 [Arthrobacter sp. SRS-W-1-2016]|nr:hypothetical protein BMF89_00360 [Arthrobacter sp. SRS-W-1-2016]
MTRPLRAPEDLQSSRRLITSTIRAKQLSRGRSSDWFHLDLSLMVVLVISLALFFDFENGFHNTANAKATPKSRLVGRHLVRGHPEAN